MKKQKSKEIKHGFFSQKAKDRGEHTVFWEDAKGNCVEVTFVSSDLENPNYQWDDVEYLGEVVCFSHIGQYGNASYGLN